MAVDEQLPPVTSENGSEAPAEEVLGLDAEDLQDHCIDLLRQGLTRREFAGELAQLIGETAGSRAVAVLSYTRRKHRLAMLGAYALSDEASAALEGGLQYSWDIPIRGLRNRRISVIEAAHRNPFVPEPIKAISPDDLVIACIPVYHENLPTAVVLLFNTSERQPSDDDLHALATMLRVGARGLREGVGLVTAPDAAEDDEIDVFADDALGRSGALAPDVRHEEVGELRRGLGALQEQRDALSARLERADEELQRLRVEVERNGKTVRTLTSSRQTLAQERDRLKTDLEEIERSRESELSELRAEVSSLEDRLLVAESDRLRHQRAAEQLRSAREQSVMALERERDSLLERVRAAESSTAAVQGALGSVREDRDRLNTQVETLTRQLEASHSGADTLRSRSEQEIASLAAERDGWKEQLATLQGEAARRAEEIRTLERSVREIQAARDASSEQLGGVREELARLSALHGEALERSRLAEAARAAALAESESVRETLAAERAEARQTEQTLRGEVEGAHATLEKAIASSSTLQARAVDLERQIAERDGQIARLQQERELVGEDAETVRRTIADHESEARRQVEALTAERDVLVARAAQAEQSLSGESERAQAETRRAASLKERVGQFQQSLAQAEAQRTALRGQLAQAQTEIDALRGQSTDRGELAHQVSELSGRVIEQEKLLSAARDEARQLAQQLGATEKQRAALAKGLQQANRERSQIGAATERDREGLREAVEQLRADRERLERERLEQGAAAQAERTVHAATVAEMQSTLEQLRAERDRAMAERHQHMASIAAAQVESDARATQALQDTQGLARRLAERERRIDELSDLLRQRDAVLERAQEERRNHTEMMQAAESALVDLRRELDAIRDERRRESQEHVERLEQIERAHKQEIQSLQQAAAERESKARPAAVVGLEGRRVARHESPLIIERSTRSGAVVESVIGAEAPAIELATKVVEGEIIVLDRGALGEDAVAVLKGAGLEARGVEPTDAGLDSLALRPMGGILLNVAPGPPAWELIRKLRERTATRDVPILAYLMNPESANGFCFGRCDFGLWPNDLSQLVETLRRLRPMVRRILVASSDVEALGRVREPLAKAHISASNVLDGKQARELGHSLQPEAAVLHFSPTCSDIARALSSYRQIEATRDLPLLLMLDKTGSARESIFFQAASRELLRTGRFDFSQLAEELIRLRTPK